MKLWICIDLPLLYHDSQLTIWVSCDKVLVKVVKIMIVAFMVILLIKFMMRFAMNVKRINEHHVTMFLRHLFFFLFFFLTIDSITLPLPITEPLELESMNPLNL